ncbi:MAG: M28 family peptidase [Verrucomicrobia bacterium]|nr:M28 family peptidase [Verrucomicrobiota bacterium]
MSQLKPITPTDVERHLRALVETIGVRLAGSPADAAAAAYIRESFEQSGAAVTVESYPIRQRDVAREELQLLIDGRWHTFPSSLFSNTPGTEGQTIEAELVFFEAPAEYRRPDLSHLTGKIVVHLGTHIESREHYRRLMEAAPAILLFVDIRYPGSVPLADGMFPAYTEALGAVPTLNVAYQDAWEWKRAGATHARVRIVGGMRPGTADNIIAELPGADDEAEILYVGGHHDTQADSVGADDNATGVVAVLTLAQALAPLKRRRTIRLISFGAEEQLSVGSAAYVRRHRAEIEARGAFMFNFDSFGSLLGWTDLICNGPDEMADAATDWFDARGHFARVTKTIVPYADHFPFVVAGVPSIFVHRPNCIAGRFFHHRPDDDMRRLSIPLLTDILNGSAAWLQELATMASLPFPRQMAAADVARANAVWQDLFNGWDG